MPASKSKANARAARRVPRSELSPDPVASFYSGAANAFRLADPATAATALYAMSEDVTVTSNGNGDAAVGFLPNLQNSQNVNSVLAGNLAASWTVTQHPQYATLTANASRVRLTGWRITVRYVGAEATAAGTMYVGTSLGFTTTMISSGMANFTPVMKAYTLRAGGTWTFYAPMLGLPDFERDSATTFNNYFGGMVFLFRGLPTSTGALIIRSERSVEYLPELSLTSLVSCVPEPYDPVREAEAGVLSGTAQDSEDDKGTQWVQHVAQAQKLLLQGGTAIAVAGAREVLRRHLGARMQLVEG